MRPYSRPNTRKKNDVSFRSTPFLNRSRERAYLYKINACEHGHLSNNLFVVESKDGKVRYTGKYFWRQAPKLPEDFIELGAGETYVVDVELSSAYAFPAAGGHYSVYYRAIDPSSPDDSTEMRSNQVEFDLS